MTDVAFETRELGKCEVYLSSVTRYVWLDPNCEIRCQGDNLIQHTRITCLLYGNGKVACKEWTILKIVLKNFPFAIPKDIDEAQDRSNPDRLGILGINRELDTSVTQKISKTAPPSTAGEGGKAP